ncbi:SUKH-4 family immunity protein [Streptomyces mangrovi]|uniref:SUKH-4 family immunity protein n=1 Tax=Streptomyces mangrovi TaxID=1206892 RepID=UPI00399CFDC6
MRELRFSVTHDELVAVFGAGRVSRSDRREAEVLGLSGPTLEFLCTVGLPSMPKAEIAAPGGDCLLWGMDEPREKGQGRSGETWNWVVLGNMPGSTLFLDPATGTVHSSYGDPSDPGQRIALHSDVSSLAYTVHAVKKALPGIAAAATYEQREEMTEEIRRYIDERDPLVFAYEDSEWAGAFDEIAMGMWT